MTGLRRADWDIPENPIPFRHGRGPLHLSFSRNDNRSMHAWRRRVGRAIENAATVGPDVDATEDAWVRSDGAEAQFPIDAVRR